MKPWQEEKAKKKGICERGNFMRYPRSIKSARDVLQLNTMRRTRSAQGGDTEERGWDGTRCVARVQHKVGTQRNKGWTDVGGDINEGAGRSQTVSTYTCTCHGSGLTVSIESRITKSRTSHNSWTRTRNTRIGSHHSIIINCTIIPALRNIHHIRRGFSPRRHGSELPTNLR